MFYTICIMLIMKRLIVKFGTLSIDQRLEVSDWFGTKEATAIFN